MSHHKNQYQITHRIKRLLERLTVMVQVASQDSELKGGQYYKGRAHGVTDVAEAVLEELGPIIAEPLGTQEAHSGFGCGVPGCRICLQMGEVSGRDRNCPVCEGLETFRVIETVPQDGKPGSIFGCMACGYEDRLV